MVWTKKQQVVSLSSAGQNCIRRAWDPKRGEGLGNILQTESTLGCFSNDVLGQPLRIGKAKHVNMQYLWIQEGSKSGQFVTKKVGSSVNPAALMTKPLPQPKIEQLMSIMGCEFSGTDVDSMEGRSTGCDGTFVTWGRRR